MGLNVPEIRTVSQNKKAEYKKFIAQIPKDTEIKFNDANKSGALDSTEWIEYEQNGQRIVGYSPYGNKNSKDTAEKIAQRLGTTTDVVKAQVGNNVNPNSFLRLTLPIKTGNVPAKTLDKAAKAVNSKKTQLGQISESRQALITEMNKDTTFNKTIADIFEFEGGYANQKGDRGGKTNMGITEKVYNNYCEKNGILKGDIKTLSKEMAKEIYYSEYWKKSGANGIKDKKLAFLHMDTAVNMGVGTAKKLRQQSGDDVNKYYQLRQQRYEKLAKIGENYKFKTGWDNRMAKIKVIIT